jgi:hypothetical protein
MERPAEGLVKATHEIHMNQIILRERRNVVRLVDRAFDLLPRPS